MPVTERQAYAIAHHAALVRDWLRETHPDAPAWDVAGIVANLHRVANRRLGDVSLATIRAAADPEARTPGVIPTAGPHWSEGLTYDAPRNPAPDDECPAHPGSWATNCHGCRADQLAGDPPRRPGRRAEDVATHAARARAALRERTHQ